MPLPENKQQLLQRLEKAQQKLLAEFDNISNSQAKLAELDKDISCCDLLAYQIEWGRLLLSWENNERNGEDSAMPAVGFKWNQLGLLAKHFYQQHQQHSLTELIAQYSQLQIDLVLWINSLEDTTLFDIKQRQWTGDKWPMVKWIQVNTIAPYQSATTKVRRWKKQMEQ